MTIEGRDVVEANDATALDRVDELLANRARIADWLERLEAQTEAPEHIIERVRADYRRRLADADAELMAHLAPLRDRHADLLSRLESVRADAVRAREAIDELALRHRIGEIDEDHREARMTDLEVASATADAEAETLRDEADSLGRILRQLERGGGTPDADERTLEAPGADIGIRTTDAPATDAPATVETGGETIHAPELDTGSAPAMPTRAEPEEDPELTRPGAGVRCRDCGYMNDEGAAYCGVCGVSVS